MSLSLLAYQAFWVVGLTFLLWFVLVKTYSASKLSAFTFVTPLFGVVASYFIMHDTLTLAFGAAALLVIAGLYLVNRPESASGGSGAGSERVGITRHCERSEAIQLPSSRHESWIASSLCSSQ